MHLNKLYVEKYKGLKDLEINFDSSNSIIDIIIGTNGSGKTQLLCLIFDIFIELFSNVNKSKKKKFKSQLGHYKISYKLEGKNIEFDSVATESWLTEDMLPRNIIVFYSGNYNPFEYKFKKIEKTKFSERFVLIDKYSYTYILATLFASKLPRHKKFLEDYFNITAVGRLYVKTLLGVPLLNADKVGTIFDTFYVYKGNGPTDGKYSTYTFEKNDIESIVSEESLYKNELDLINNILRIKKYKIKSKPVLEIIQSRFIKDDTEISNVDLSEGEKQQITLFGLSNILAGSETLILLDEADSFIHHSLQKKLVDQISEEANESLHYIFTTHSFGTLAGIQKETKVLDAKNGFNSISPIYFEEYIKVFEDFNELISKVQSDNQELQNNLDQISQKVEPVIITEGCTDWMHLLAALRYFHSQNQYLEIKESYIFQYNNDSENKYIGGNDKLEKLLQYRSNTPNSRKVIGIFDSDTTSVNDFHNNCDYRILDNMVYSFIIPMLVHRQDMLDRGISIEHYYTDQEIKKEIKINGLLKRLYFGSEFIGSKVHRNIDNAKLILHGHNDKIGTGLIIDCDVFNEDEQNLALSKMQFAENILNNVPEFTDFDFSNFSLIFDKILLILEIQ